jgi:glycosyltransferase involved in cell wall biosynthesis
MNELQEPMVSICSTTYNLEKYIAQAIESWLAQKTNFDFEIVICDDGSVDNTTNIIGNYIEKYPTKIRLLIAEKNQGMMPNFIWSLESARGKYIAVCDGDDYWIDDNKLQMQIDFLEANPQFSSCYTNSLVKNELTNEFVVAKKNVWDEADTIDLFEHNDFQNDNIPLSPGHISAYVFRNNLINKYPDWFYKIDGVTDFPLFMMISKFGKAKFFNVNTSVF